MRLMRERRRVNFPVVENGVVLSYNRLDEACVVFLVYMSPMRQIGWEKRKRVKEADIARHRERHKTSRIKLPEHQLWQFFIHNMSFAVPQNYGITDNGIRRYLYRPFRCFPTSIATMLSRSSQVSDRDENVISSILNRHFIIPGSQKAIEKLFNDFSHRFPFFHPQGVVYCEKSSRPMPSQETNRRF